MDNVYQKQNIISMVSFPRKRESKALEKMDPRFHGDDNV